MSPVPAVAGRRCVHDGSVVASGTCPRRPRCHAVAGRHTVAHRRLSTPDFRAVSPRHAASFIHVQIHPHMGGLRDAIEIFLRVFIKRSEQHVFPNETNHHLGKCISSTAALLCKDDAFLMILWHICYAKLADVCAAHDYQRLQGASVTCLIISTLLAGIVWCRNLVSNLFPWCFRARGLTG